MSIITEIPKKFFIFEMANNHMGDLNHAIKLIDEFSKIKKKFSNFKFGFKLQFRNLKTFIHKSKIDRIDLNYIKRFKETELPELKFKKIVHHIKKSGFISLRGFVLVPGIVDLVFLKYSKSKEYFLTSLKFS